jgi:hypothetical protein
MYSPYRTVNSLLLSYTNQSGKDIQWNNRSLFWDQHKTHKYSPYRAVNTLRLSYTNQSVNAVQWNNRWLFSLQLWPNLPAPQPPCTYDPTSLHLWPNLPAVMTQPPCCYDRTSLQLWPNLPALMTKPPCSPDIVPSDFHLFRPLMEHLAGKRFVTDADVKHLCDKW